MSDISELKFDSKNFNKHTQRGMGLLEKSLQELGAGRSVLVDKDDNIIAGNGIVEAAANAGITKTKVIETDGTELVVVKRKDMTLDSDKGREMALADNATAAADLEWDSETLSEVFTDEELKRWDVDIQLEEDNTEIEEDEAPEVEATTDTKPGDIFILGGHKVMCGDSTDQEALEKLVGGGRLVDMWLTDPPYNVAIQGGNHGDPDRTDGLRIENDSMSDEDFRAFLQAACVSAWTVMKPGAAFYIWHADTEGYNFRAACKSSGLMVKECLIWNKNSMVMGRQDYQWKHEPCLYGWKEGTHSWYSDRKQTTVIDFDRPTKNKEHPTMKPVGLMAYLIKNSTKPGDLVLDSFGGSGSTLIACEETGRQCVTMELDPHYVDVIVKRWENLTGKKARKAEA